MTKLFTIMRNLLREAVGISFRLFRIMVPVIVIVKILQEIGGVEFLGALLAPVMKLVGLPGSMGLVWATAMLSNLYSGMVVLATLSVEYPLTVAQATVLTCMMLVAHTLPIELRIAQKAGVRLYFSAILRVGGAFLFGWLLYTVYSAGDWLRQPNTISWIPAARDPSPAAWAVSQIQALALIFVVIAGLLALMKALDRLRATELITGCLNPLLKLLGIGRSAATIAVIGMTLGIAYGGGLIIHEAQSGRVDRKDVLFSLSLMGLCHSIVEDTLLAAMFGGHISGILWARLVFALISIFLLVKWVSRLSESTLDRFFFNACASDPESTRVTP